MRTYAGFVDERRTYAFGLTPFSFAVIAAIVLVVTASLSLSEALEGKAIVPADQSTPPR